MTDRSDTGRERWQRELLPLMTRMIVALTVFFFFVSMLQLAYLHWRIEDSATIELELPIERLVEGAGDSFDQLLLATRLDVFTKLEVIALERRYHQANVLLMSRVWARYMGFVTGMILCMVGATFILGKLEEGESEVAGGGQDLSFTVKTASPGVFLAAMGTLLIITTIAINHRIEVTDRAVYTWQALEGATTGLADEAPSITIPNNGSPDEGSGER